MEVNKNVQSTNTLNSIDRFSRAINLAKGFAILLVVLGHMNSPFSSGIYSFHIPLFFIIGGVFINIDNAVWQYLKKNLLRLAFPFILFGILGWAVNVVKLMLLHRPHENLNKELVGLFWWMDIDHLQHYGFVLWFLPALFWARIIIFFVEKYLYINQVVIAFIFLFISFISSTFDVLPLAFDKGLLALPWVFFGFLVNRFKVSIIFNGSCVWQAIVSIGFVTILVCLYGILPLDMARKNIGELYLSFPYTLSVSYLVIFSAFYISHSIKISRYLILIGKSSMLVLVFHPYVNNFSHLIIGRYFNDIWYCKFLVSLLVLSLLVAIKDRYSKNLIFKFF